MDVQSEPQPRKGLLIKADPIASAFQAEIQSALQRCDRKPKLVGILATSSAPSKFYADFTRKQCENLGFEFVLKKTGAAEDGENGAAKGEGEGVEEAIIEANEDDTVDGIMVYYPIFGAQQDHYLQQIVSPFKDVEGLNFKFHYNLYHNIRFIEPKSLNSASPATSAAVEVNTETPPPGTVKSILPCTPLAIVKCLEHVGVYNTILPYGDRAYGKTVTEYTKRPSSSTQRYHPHHVVHPTSLTLEDCLAQSDVVISAVPNVSYKVKTTSLKPGCICVNVSAEKNFEANASMYLPAVGKVTIMMLLRNLLRLSEYKQILSS
ncbi:hypothetical protein ONZ45_g6827 [Pleurotus djamor]|nr:hypothetical protein ONZ45_g12295 [Pleurotus djamor]KAJ8515777.1 hypothetical protein ONZ45_g6827 [Pleurotus djamor]